ncbi:FAD-binding protein [Alkalibacillus silvisoli]|uniref:L-aspartate oxidase n=1 Tax=Alkalibacillus silvisoli TaxID=392823 RepID=A0ABN0ZT81_9BACI
MILLRLPENNVIYRLLANPESNECYGAQLIDSNEQFYTITASHTVLATGGCGSIYEYTSNSSHALGDGVVLAHQVGAVVSDLEFIQFHPTLLYLNDETYGLISEAVRGEGAILVNQNGKPIMDSIHPLKDLAPRHIVAQTIYNNKLIGNDVYLSVANINQFQTRFPSISKLCTEYGIDIESGLIPISPGAHFMIGGVVTNIKGETNINRLYCIGEVANTGLHGANRLASNSLLEGLVMGQELANHLNNQPLIDEEITLSTIEKNQVPELPPLYKLKNSMMENVGIIREFEQLKKQHDWLNLLLNSSNLVEVNIETFNRFVAYKMANLITTAALIRTESLGCHHMVGSNIALKHTHLERGEYVEQI